MRARVTVGRVDCLMILLVRIRVETGLCSHGRVVSGMIVVRGGIYQGRRPERAGVPTGRRWWGGWAPRIGGFLPCRLVRQ